MNSKIQFMTFNPDVIVETTSVCDRACVGCYAPNVVSRESTKTLLKARPELFLSPEKFKISLEHMPAGLGTASFRGGEPTRNPALPDLIKIASKFFAKIFIETHGQWILGTTENQELFDAIQETGAILKLSFDKMHGLSRETLSKITRRLDSLDIAWCVAITETKAEEFFQIRMDCYWVPDSQIIFQKKAVEATQLVSPKFGVIKMDGSWHNGLSTKWKASEPTLEKASSLGIALLASIIFGLTFTQRASAADIRIGLASNFSEISSSNSNPYGDYFRKGIQLALKDSQAQLKKKNLNVVLEEFDYGTSQAKVASAVNQAVDSKVVAVLGYNLSPHALIAAPIHHSAKLPMISSSATANRLGRFGKYVHLGSFGNEFMGQTLALTSTQRLKAKRAALIVADDCAYCSDLAEAFESEFKKLGGSISTRIGILDSQKDFSRVISDGRLKEADVIVLPNYELTAIRVITALQAAGIDKPFLGGDGWGDTGEEFYRILGDKKVTGYSLSHWHPDLNDNRSVKFKKDFVDMFGKEPNDTAVLAYDSMLLLLEAAYRAKTYTREDIEQSLNSIRNFEGVTGKFAYSDSHRAPEKSIVLLKVGAQRFQVVDRMNPHFQKRLK